MDANKPRTLDTIEIILYRQPRTKSLQYLAIQPLILDLSAVRILERAQEEQHKTRLSRLNPHPSTLRPIYDLHKGRLLQKTPSSKSLMATPPPHRRAKAKNRGGAATAAEGVVSGQVLWHTRPFRGPADLDPGEALNDILEKINETFNVERAITSSFRPSRLVIRVRTAIIRAFAWLFAMISYILRPFLVALFLLRVFAEMTLSALNTKFPSSNVALKDISAGEGITSTVNWLMGWPPPVGLKLNSELNHFLGQLFLWLLQMWNESIIPLRIHLAEIITAIGFSGAFGASMVVALLSDLFAITTLHIYVFYNVAAKIYNWQVKVILSLFTLFRGKKRNVLRNRVDSAEFDLDQLLLGTILFTVLVFLFPTVAVYYVLFSLTRVMIIGTQAVFEIVLALLNHFPLFAIMLRFKDPGRLPVHLLVREVEVELPYFWGYKVVVYRQEVGEDTEA
ncbi:phosphatidylinositol N-acetylglucosaminyltransferase subunit gpi1 [Dinochytrium kinnereticum]|nr:phosphatidylinositol N-acetylglucosaminyltransferase subunit gpi1 [Dinochytrium kinnereticum]